MKKQTTKIAKANLADVAATLDAETAAHIAELVRAASASAAARRAHQERLEELLAEVAELPATVPASTPESAQWWADFRSRLVFHTDSSAALAAAEDELKIVWKEVMSHFSNA